MKASDIIALVNAGFTKADIAALAKDEPQPQPQPQPQPEGNVTDKLEALIKQQTESMTALMQSIARQGAGTDDADDDFIKALIK